jgi:hypothetical protein
MNKGYETKDNKIIINRDLTELDKFVKDFVEVINKHTNYLIVSGFITICCGRTRATEDIDLLMPILKEEEFKRLFEDLNKNDFWCYQGDSSKEVYEYIKNMNSIRFAKKGEMFPNMEVVPFNKSKKAKCFEFNHPQIIQVKNFEFKAPWIEFEILYKERVLAGEKDIKDAQHLREFFKEILKKERFKESEKVIEEETK